jgi:Ca-activated chloride channel family protein
MKNTLLLVIALIVSMQIQSQEKKITGTVSDNSGDPLPGVNIVIKKPLQELKQILKVIMK